MTDIAANNWAGLILGTYDIMEIGRKLATEEDGVLFAIGVTLACLQKAGKLTRQTSHRNTTLRRGP